MKKEKIFILFLISLLCINNVFAIAISPARTIVQFKPNMEFDVGYSVSSSYSDKDIDLFVEGDLTEYATLSKDTLPSEGGSFSVSVKLPEKIEPPGKKLMYIAAREKIDKELAKGALGVSVAIRSVLAVYVPYPGKYLETELRAHNVNIEEPITFELDVYSRGTDEVLMKPRIEIYDEHGNLIDTIYFLERAISGQSEIFLKKTMNTTGIFAGNYYALSKIDYDTATAESRADFKIGELRVDILNYTKQIIVGGIRKFEIEIESGWNDQIDGAYAEIIILNNSEKITEFKTSPTNLNPWESKIITGYLDATEIMPGMYDANITIVYYGRDKGKSTNKLVQVEFIEKEKINYLLISGVVLGIIILFVVLFCILKYGKKKKR